ncbi:MAG: hypothetical protein VKK04_18895 [Synechococcales bacterium]|nr:hypothetical protein [Synechococcales bacterium]
MKYTIQRKRLPHTRDDQIYTLIIFLGELGNGNLKDKELRVQYPVSSHREGIVKYREVRQFQKWLEQREQCSGSLLPDAAVGNLVPMPQ